MKRRPFNRSGVWLVMTAAVALGWLIAYVMGYGSVRITLIMSGVLFVMLLCAAGAATHYNQKLFAWYVYDNPKAVRSLFVSGTKRTTHFGPKELAMTQDAYQVEYTIVTSPKARYLSQRMPYYCEMSTYLIRKACNSIYNVQNAKILAVNNQQIAHTSTSPSVGGALLGGLAFGTPGFILGAAHSHSTTRYSNGENEYTFLIMFKDGRTCVKKVKESSSDFEVLVKFLKFD